MQVACMVLVQSDGCWVAQANRSTAAATLPFRIRSNCYNS